jgi:hypothetical protein
LMVSPDWNVVLIFAPDPCSSRLTLCSVLRAPCSLLCASCSLLPAPCLLARSEPRRRYETGLAPNHRHRQAEASSSENSSLADFASVTTIRRRPTHRGHRREGPTTVRGRDSIEGSPLLTLSRKGTTPTHPARSPGTTPKPSAAARTPRSRVSRMPSTRWVGFGGLAIPSRAASLLPRGALMTKSTRSNGTEVAELITMVLLANDAARGALALAQGAEAGHGGEAGREQRAAGAGGWPSSASENPAGTAARDNYNQLFQALGILDASLTPRSGHTGEGIRDHRRSRIEDADRGDRGIARHSVVENACVWGTSGSWFPVVPSQVAQWSGAVI